MFAKYKPVIITLSVIALIAAGVVNYVKDLIGQPPESAPEHLQVKAPAEKILHSQKIKDEQGNDVVKYLYASETEVTAETIKIDEREIKEDISKRTKNAQFFKKRGLHSPEGLWSQDADTQEGSTASLRSDYGANGEANGSTAPVAAEDNEAVAANESEKEVWVGRFYAGEPFYKDAGNNKWYQTETATTTAEEFSKQTKPGFLARIKSFFGMNALADIGSYYAGAGDGRIYNSGSPWNAVQTAVQGNNADSTSVWLEGPIVRPVPITGWGIARSFFPIDTSNIDDGATIESAILKLYGFDFFGVWFYSYATDRIAGNSKYYVVGPTSQANTSQLIIEDFDQCGEINNPTAGSPEYENNQWIAGYNDLVLNADGISWINKTGITKLGIRQKLDCINIAPVGRNSIYVCYSEQTGTSQDPYLEVTYTVPAAPAKFRFDGGQMKIKGKVKFE